MYINLCVTRNLFGRVLPSSPRYSVEIDNTQMIRFSDCLILDPARLCKSLPALYFMASFNLPLRGKMSFLHG